MLKIIDKKPSIIEDTKELLSKIFNPDQPKFIVGINDLCDHLLEVFTRKQIPIAGIVDDFTNKTEYFNFPIFKSKNLPKDALIISCVVDGRLITAIDNLKSYGIHNILTYLELYLTFPELFKQVRFCENNVTDIEKNLDNYQWLYSILEDEYSKQTLEHILDFRYNFKIDSMRFFNFQLKNQYFDEFIRFDNNEVFVDCGGFDGNTTISFISRNSTYKKAYYFEPAPEQFNISKNNLSNYSNVELYNMATYNCNTKLMFDSNHGSSSSISNNGNIEIQAVKLDDIIKDSITYLKMDVEGAEFPTLQGAEQLIKKYKPKIAVCVYHDQSDFWRIPKLVLGFNPAYKVYIRHYTEGLLETVMYFV